MSFTTVNHLTDIIPLLQASISPVAVISGVGLIVLSSTNRYGRVIDRTRKLMKEHGHIFRELQQPPHHHQQPEAALEQAEEPHHEETFPKHIFYEIQVLYKRARVLRMCIVFNLVSLFFIVITIGLLFSGLLFGFNLMLYTAEAFMLGLGSLLVSLTYFIRDMTLSLKAIKYEIGYNLPWSWISD